MKQTITIWQDRYKHLSFWIATFGGSGLLSPAPGTWGSLAGLVVALLMIQAGISADYFTYLLIAVCVVGTIAINKIEAASGIHDAPEIVIDEVAGQWIAIMPLFVFGFSLPAIVFAFILFRAFDIIKPWPIGWLDKKVSGGFGVMVDDIVAGSFAAGTISLMAIYVPSSLY